MTIRKFRKEMAFYRESAIDEPGRPKDDPFSVVEALLSILSMFSDQECELAEQVILEWILAEDRMLRFDALGLICALQLQKAKPQLTELMQRMASGKSKADKLEVGRIKAVIEHLASWEQAEQLPKLQVM